MTSRKTRLERNERARRRRKLLNDPNWPAIVLGGRVEFDCDSPSALGPRQPQPGEFLLSMIPPEPR